MTAQRNGNVLSWASDLDERTQDQAQRAAAMPFVEKPLALMADAHLGMGATIGSVIATHGAIIPAAVGVDIGCGMIAGRLNLTSNDLPDSLKDIHHSIARSIPAGVPNRGRRDEGSHRDERDFDAGSVPSMVKESKVRRQFGTLGSGNHFVEMCLDEADRVWIVLHSGSRGAGNQVARHHIEGAKDLMQRYFIELDDKDLAYLVAGTNEFESYIRDMLWAQDYAAGNREAMLAAVLKDLRHALGEWVDFAESLVNCHHNYTEMEHHHDKNLWITRKGAIRARVGDRGVIPGSMATGSFIVRGLGNAASYCSASHGAGRRMSRTAARKRLTQDSLVAAMAGITWNESPKDLLDEHPEAYKDITQVMVAQADLVEVEERLTTILNYKGS
jgi:tRNA-splicing ligase RtcB (3'-phosphate/5'-hydroxy nucleic acid ligase)